jgi:tetratricopeptide (TPR) repeat protein
MLTRKQYLALWNKATTLKRKGLNAEAIDLYRQVEPYIENIQKFLPRQENVPEEQYVKSLSFRQAAFWADLMGAQCDNKDYQNALESSRKAVTLKGEQYLPYVYYNTGNIYLRLKQYGAAIEWYDKAIAEFRTLHANHTKEEGNYLCNKGEALFMLHEFEKAEPVLLESIDANPDNEEAYLFLSEIYTATKRKKESDSMRKKYETRKAKRTAKEP